jgi:methyl-accepting chemotaxis protein
LGELLNDSRQLNQVMAQVTSATEEQADGVEQVNIAVTQMDQVTQSNAASAEESATASDALNQQADQLARLVGRLEGLVRGKRGGVKRFEPDTDAPKKSRRKQAEAKDQAQASSTGDDDDEFWSQAPKAQAGASDESDSFEGF